MEKYLVAGLGNIGAEYAHTRHNIGFRILDHLAQRHGVGFHIDRLGATAEIQLKNKVLVLLKPSTYMNLSGKAVRYHLNDNRLTPDRLLVVCDDLALPFGTLRLKAKGSHGGHNGLRNISEMLGTEAYARFRFGIGNDFARGGQVDYVLGEWTSEEESAMAERLDTAADLIESFALAGIERTMNQFNGK